MLAIKTIADIINEDCDNFDYFHASGLIRDTLKLWKKPVNYALLNEVAQTMADRYNGTQT